MTNSNKPQKRFWVIAVISLLWNGMGVNQYLQQAYNTDAFKAMYPDEKVMEMVQNTPSWAMTAFALAVFGGFIGSIFLLLRRKLAKPMFLISLVAIVIQMFYNLFMSGAMEVYGPGAVIMPIMVIGFALFILWYTKRSEAKGILS
ncbi:MULTISPECIES: hypothetical protein [unclassified Tenacibaculum]|uniref:hypothetical protein n=1 Tax=unclassified Tenacibaculum TaxID=2635139 RepID=UPI001F1C4BF4|nr:MULTISPECIES: hypothetical protein [unclassified Tenacibaculum]MCF2874215.1 hypothetical protein [Tenacibaculum sp. Cn5-1]MCF2934796.1 hypothetical protein [Tenacibaculum sp. Cn5-34]MCG7511006.1 hypothetical protein [Tenacibaculum sp. Cn5-46]